MVNRMVFFYVYVIAERFTSDFGESLLPVLFSPTEPKNTPIYMTLFKILKLNQRISASVQGTPRRGNEHIAQGIALGYVLAGPSARSLNACQLQVNTCACLNDLILEEQKRERLRRKPSYDTASLL